MVRDSRRGVGTGDLSRSITVEYVARQVAAAAIERGFDQLLSDVQKSFLFMPYMHSEALSDQDYVLTLFEQAGLLDNLRWAKHHREIVVQFGRFPHRNAIIGRECTAEELAWLASDRHFWGE